MSPFGRKVSGINAKKAEAVRLLAVGMTVLEVARELGIAERTLYRWKEQPEFKRLTEGIQAEAVERVVQQASEEISQRLKSMLPDALDVLHEFIQSPEKRGSDRLAAIRILGQWSGLGSNQNQPKESPVQVDSMQDYLKFLSRNGYSKSAD